MNAQRDSGGVSGEDGELIELAARLERVSDIGIAISRQGAANCVRAIRELLAERDGLKTDLTTIREAIEVKGGNEHMPTYDAYMAACKAVNNVHDALSASEAALADALGLLMEPRSRGDHFPYAYATFDWLKRRDEFIAKHAKSEEAKGAA